MSLKTCHVSSHEMVLIGCTLKCGHQKGIKLQRVTELSEEVGGKTWRNNVGIGKDPGLGCDTHV